MGKVNDLICFPVCSKALHVLQKRGEKGSDLMGNALTLWRAQCHPPRHCVESLAFPTAMNMTSPQILQPFPLIPHKQPAAHTAAWTSLTDIQPPTGYGQDGLVGLTYMWEIPSRSWDKIKKQQIKAIRHQFCSEDPLLIQARNTPLTQAQAATQLSWGKSWHCPAIKLQHQILVGIQDKTQKWIPVLQTPNNPSLTRAHSHLIAGMSGEGQSFARCWVKEGFCQKPCEGWIFL